MKTRTIRNLVALVLSVLFVFSFAAGESAQAAESRFAGNQTASVKAFDFQFSNSDAFSKEAFAPESFRFKAGTFRAFNRDFARFNFDTAFNSFDLNASSFKFQTFDTFNFRSANRTA